MASKSYSLDSMVEVSFKNLTKPVSSKSFDKIVFVIDEAEAGTKWKPTDRKKDYNNFDDFKADKFDETKYVFKAVEKAFRQERIGKLSIARKMATDASMDEALDAIDEAMQGNFFYFTTSMEFNDLIVTDEIQKWAEKTDHVYIKALNEVSFTDKYSKTDFIGDRILNQYRKSSIGYDENIEANASDLIFCLCQGATLSLERPGFDAPEKTDGFNDFIGILPTELNSEQIKNLTENRIWYITNQNNKVFFRNVVNAYEHAYSKELSMFLGQDIFFTFVLTWLKIVQQERIFSFHMSPGRKYMDNQTIASVRGICKSVLSEAINYKLLLPNGDNIDVNGVATEVKNEVSTFTQGSLTQSQRQSGELGRFEENIFIPNAPRIYKLGINYSS
jgi:hypothetical protein